MTPPVESVSKAIAILRAFSKRNYVLSVRQIAELTDIPKSTCHSLCSTLLAEGLIERVPGVGMRLSHGLVAIAAPVTERQGLLEACMPTMQRFSQLGKGEVFLGVLAFPWIVFISRVRMRDTPSPMPERVGLRLPLHTTPGGLSMLADLPAPSLNEYLESHSASEFLIRSDVERVRTLGYAAGESFEKGIHSVSIAVKPGSTDEAGFIAARR